MQRYIFVSIFLFLFALFATDAKADIYYYGMSGPPSCYSGKAGASPTDSVANMKACDPGYTHSTTLKSTAAQNASFPKRQTYCLNYDGYGGNCPYLAYIYSCDIAPYDTIEVSPSNPTDPKCVIKPCPDGKARDADGKCPVAPSDNGTGGGDGGPCNIPAHTKYGSPGIERPIPDADLDKTFCWQGCKVGAIITDFTLETYQCTKDHQALDSSGQPTTPANGLCKTLYSHYETTGEKCDTTPQREPPKPDPNATDPRPDKQPPERANCIKTKAGRTTCFKPTQQGANKPPGRTNCVEINGEKVCLGSGTECIKLDQGGFSCTRKTPANQKPPTAPPDASTKEPGKPENETADHYPPEAGKPADASVTRDQAGNSICGQPGVTCAVQGGGSTPGGSSGSTPNPSSSNVPTPSTGKTGGTATGGETCVTAPSCSGDSVGCAQLQQEWLTRCSTDGHLAEYKPAPEMPIDRARFSMDDPNKSKIQQLQDRMNAVRSPEVTPTSLIQDFQIEVFGASINIPISKLAPLGILIGILLAASASFWVIKLIVSKGHD